MVLNISDFEDLEDYERHGLAATVIGCYYWRCCTSSEMSEMARQGDWVAKTMGI